MQRRNEEMLLALAIAYLVRHHDEIDDVASLVESITIEHTDREIRGAWIGYASQIMPPDALMSGPLRAMLEAADD